MLKCTIKSRPEGVEINISAIFTYGPGLMKRAQELQNIVTEEVEKMTAFNILADQYRNQRSQACSGIGQEKE